MIKFIDTRIEPDFRVFEYGSGNSTHWWSRRVSTLVSVEHDRKWFESVSESIPVNVDYRYVELENDGAYSRAALACGELFEIIIIDGRDRVNCAKHALDALSSSGVILWDNSDRVRYNEGYKFLQEMGFRRMDFFGISPINTEESCTTVFYRNDNCLRI